MRGGNISTLPIRLHDVVLS